MRVTQKFVRDLKAHSAQMADGTPSFIATNWQYRDMSPDISEKLKNTGAFLSKGQEIFDNGEWNQIAEHLTKKKVGLIASLLFDIPNFLKGLFNRSMIKDVMPVKIRHMADNLDLYEIAGKYGKNKFIAIPFKGTRGRRDFFAKQELEGNLVKTRNGMRLSLRTIDKPKNPKQKMNVSDIAGIVECQYQKYSFYGRWERDTNFDEIAKEFGYPGLRCGLYVEPKSKAAILVFEGTRVGNIPSLIDDMKTNIAATQGKYTSQYSLAPLIAKAAEKLYPSLLVVGHSKGGGIAQFAAANTGLPCVTFNTVGLPAFDKETEAKNKVYHYFTKYDLISNVAGKLLEDGSSIHVTKNNQRLLKGETVLMAHNISRLSFFKLHSIRTCINQLRGRREVLDEIFPLVPKEKQQKKMCRPYYWHMRRQKQKTLS